MENLEEKQVGQIAAEDYRAARVFEDYKIDFCCHGERTLQEVATEKGIQAEILAAKINETTSGPISEQDDFNTWALDKLADHIVEKHHKYAEKQIGILKPNLEKIVRVHGDRHPELQEIKALFNDTAGDIVSHQKKEEIILFPFIRKMVQAKTGNDIFRPVKSVENPVKMLTGEHDIQTENFIKMEELSNHFTPPEDACETYRATLGILKAFRLDLHKHIHLENNILFPKALLLEHQLTGK